VDLCRGEALDYLLDGWIPRGDVSLTYGPFGTGKTTLAVLKAYCYAKGINLLDRSTTCTPGRSLFIATDSGAAALKKAFSDLGIDPDTDPLLKPGSPTQSIWIWAYEPDQGHDAWICDIHGVIRLEKFIQEKGITYVPIDSAKSVSAAAGWSYTANESVKALLKFLREGICQPFGCCIDFLSHDGSEKGASSGAKAWAEDPSMVCSLSLSKGENGEPDAVKVEFRKDRAAVVDARRTLSYRLIDQTVELVPGSEIVGNCEEAIATVLWEAHQRDMESITTAALMDECWARFKKSRKTVENTLGRIAGTGKGPTPTPVIRPRKGHLSLSPREIQRRSAVTGSPNRGVGEMGGVNRKAPAPQGICPTPIATPDRGVRGLAQPPLKSVGGWEGGGQTPVTTGDLLATPPSGGMAPPKTGSSWDLDDGDDPHWPPRPLEPQPDDDPNRPF
jgi:RecA/RadA recombinase